MTSAAATTSSHAHVSISSNHGSNKSHSALPRSMAGDNNIWLVAIVVSIATFMEVLDTSIANVSLRYIAGDLAVSIDESTWVLTSYLVSNAIVLPISGWLASVFGRKRFYMACVAIFTLSSLACGFAPSLPWLVVFRILQGIGGGGLAPSEQSILADTFTPKQRGVAFAIYGIAVVFAPAVGPTLGGWITDNYSWHWIFLINVPVGILSLCLSHVMLVEPKAETQERRRRIRKGLNIDYVGFGLVAVGLGCLQVVLDRGERNDWFESSFIVWFSIISGVSIVALIVWELVHPHPIVNLKLFGQRTFASSSVLMFALGFILFGTTQLLPQMTQDLFGYNATLAGLVITPGGFVVMCMMPFVGFLVGHWQPRYLVAIGMLIEGLAMWHLSTLELGASYHTLAMARIYQAAGLAFLFVPITNASYVGLKPNQTNEASALINLMRNLGGSFGISIAQALILQRAQFHQSRLVENITPTDPQYHQTLNRIAEGLVHRGAPPAAAIRAAVQQIGEIVMRQAQILSYLEVFRLMAYFAFAALPLVFLLKRAKPGQAAMH